MAAIMPFAVYRMLTRAGRQETPARSAPERPSVSSWSYEHTPLDYTRVAESLGFKACANCDQPRICKMGVDTMVSLLSESPDDYAEEYYDKGVVPVGDRTQAEVVYEGFVYDVSRASLRSDCLLTEKEFWTQALEKNEIETQQRESE